MKVIVPFALSEDEQDKLMAHLRHMICVNGVRPKPAPLPALSFVERDHMLRFLRQQSKRHTNPMLADGCRWAADILAKVSVEVPQ